MIEHPNELKPSNVTSKPIVVPEKLTKDEMRKKRRSERAEKMNEIRQKIKIGEMEAPAPKVKMANLMSVLTDDAIQDPTKMEKYVREQAILRQK